MLTLDLQKVAKHLGNICKVFVDYQASVEKEVEAATNIFKNVISGGTGKEKTAK